MSQQTLKKIIQKLKEIGGLDARRGRGSKRISNEYVEEEAFAVVK